MCCTPYDMARVDVDCVCLRQSVQKLKSRLKATVDSKRMSCSICFEEFNKSSRKQTTCCFCDVSVCREDVQKYLLMDTSTEPNCPSCRAVWNRDFLNRELTGTFRNGPLRLHREKVLMDRERARFQETQEEAEAYKWARTMVPILQEQSTELYYRVPKIDHTHPDWIEWQRVNERVRNLLFNVGRETAAGAGAPKKARAVFIHKCPGTGCEGFLSTQWKCGLCGGAFCKDCHEPKVAATGHTCNPDLVESVKAIKKEAKPCPKCASQISKIDGCDQMWCTQCHTAFSWRTGEIETHVVHNPHYFQWMRELGGGAVPRAPGDVPPPCGGVRVIFARLVQGMLWSEVPADNTVLPPAKFQDETIYCRLTHYIQLLQHIQHYELPLCRQGIDDASWEEARRRFRVQRMVGLISSHTRLRLKMQKEEASLNMDDNWKHELVLLENRVLRARAKVQLMDMYTTAGMDIIGQILEGDVTEEKVKSIYGQFGALYKYVEKANKEFSRAYSTKEIKIQP